MRRNEIQTLLPLIIVRLALIDDSDPAVSLSKLSVMTFHFRLLPQLAKAFSAIRFPASIWKLEISNFPAFCTEYA